MKYIKNKKSLTIIENMLKLTVILLIAFFGHSYGRPVQSNPLSESELTFGFNLLNHLSDNKNNVFYSPLSISMAFGMLYSGAKGKTAQELRDVLGYNSQNLLDQQIKDRFKKLLTDMSAMDSKIDLNIANKLIVQKDFEILETFKEDLKKYFDSSIESVDFGQKSLEVMNSINQW